VKNLSTAKTLYTSIETMQSYIRINVHISESSCEPLSAENNTILSTYLNISNAKHCE